MNKTSPRLHTTFRMLWLLRRWDYFVWLWASLWSKGIVSEILRQALVLIPVSVVFFNRKDSVINACNLSDRQRERKFHFMWKRTRKHEQKEERKIKTRVWRSIFVYAKQGLNSSQQRLSQLKTRSMYCMVSNALCIIHGDFKISIIDENIEKKIRGTERTEKASIWKNNDAIEGNVKTQQTQHQRLCSETILLLLFL